MATPYTTRVDQVVLDEEGAGTANFSLPPSRVGGVYLASDPEGTADGSATAVGFCFGRESQVQFANTSEGLQEFYPGGDADGGEPEPLVGGACRWEVADGDADGTAWITTYYHS